MNTIINESEKLLLQGNIGRALDFISHEAKVIGMSDVAEKAMQLHSGFNYMLEYFFSGANDPTRQDMLAQIYDDAYDLVSTMSYRQANKDRIIPRIADACIKDSQELFDAVENNFPSTKEDRAALQHIILNEDLPLYLRAMTLSALTLNLLKYFDNEKFESLYTYTLEDQPLAIRQRAWVAIVLVTMANDHRISTQPRLVEQLRFFCEEGTDVNGMNVMLAIQIALFQCLEANNARKILKDELTPDIEKGLKEIKRLKGDSQAGNDDEDMNPLWEEYLEKSGIQDKLKDFIEMQKNGIDIMFDAFTHMSHIPFFKFKHNWFTPFDLEHPDVKEMIGKSDLHTNFIKVMCKSGNMCSTDKYSNVFMMNFMPESQIRQVEDAINANNVKIEDIIGATPEEEIINYLHDLYRYYHIFIGATKKYNPFNRNPYFGKYGGLSSVVAHIEVKYSLAEFLMKNKRYRDATILFKEIAGQEVKEDVLQKYAYCIMKTDPDDPEYGDILALCNSFYPNNKWTIKHYANSLMLSFKYHAAELVLRDGCRAFPDDVNLIISLAKCLMEQDRYDDAMNLWFKADLLKENSYKIQHNLAWCAFVLGNKETAERYISQVLEMPNAQSNDWINGGHIALLNGDLRLAIDRYHKSESDDLMFAFIDDNDKMLKAGIPQDIITLTHEVLNRNIN